MMFSGLALKWITFIGLTFTGFGKSAASNIFTKKDNIQFLSEFPEVSCPNQTEIVVRGPLPVDGTVRQVSSLDLNRTQHSFGPKFCNFLGGHGGTENPWAWFTFQGTGGYVVVSTCDNNNNNNNIQNEATNENGTAAFSIYRADDASTTNQDTSTMRIAISEFSRQCITATYWDREHYCMSVKKRAEIPGCPEGTVYELYTHKEITYILSLARINAKEDDKDTTRKNFKVALYNQPPGCQNASQIHVGAPPTTGYLDSNKPLANSYGPTQWFWYHGTGNNVTVNLCSQNQTQTEPRARVTVYEYSGSGCINEQGQFLKHAPTRDFTLSFANRYTWDGTCKSVVNTATQANRTYYVSVMAVERGRYRGDDSGTNNDIDYTYPTDQFIGGEFQISLHDQFTGCNPRGSNYSELPTLAIDGVLVKGTTVNGTFAGGNWCTESEFAAPLVGPTQWFQFRGTGSPIQIVSFVNDKHTCYEGCTTGGPKDMDENRNRYVAKVAVFVGDTCEDLKCVPMTHNRWDSAQQTDDYIQTERNKTYILVVTTYARQFPGPFTDTLALGTPNSFEIAIFERETGCDNSIAVETNAAIFQDSINGSSFSSAFTLSGDSCDNKAVFGGRTKWYTFKATQETTIIYSERKRHILGLYFSKDTYIYSAGCREMHDECPHAIVPSFIPLDLLQTEIGRDYNVAVTGWGLKNQEGNFFFGISSPNHGCQNSVQINVVTDGSETVLPISNTSGGNVHPVVERWPTESRCPGMSYQGGLKGMYAFYHFTGTGSNVSMSLCVDYIPGLFYGTIHIIRGDCSNDNAGLGECVLYHPIRQGGRCVEVNQSTDLGITYFLLIQTDIVDEIGEGVFSLIQQNMTLRVSSGEPLFSSNSTISSSAARKHPGPFLRWLVQPWNFVVMGMLQQFFNS